MNRLFILLVWTILIAADPMTPETLAQGPHPGHGMDSGSWTGACATLESLMLSSDQREAIDRIESRYRDRILAYRQDLMIKRLALRDLLRDFQTSEADIRQKSGEMEEARRLLHWEMISYQLDIRKILTPEQAKRWCTMIQGPSAHGGWKGRSGFRQRRDR